METQVALNTSQKQLEANRQNALKSTGPKTEEGKAISARNAIKHGIFAKEVVITTGDGKEDESEYYKLLNRLQEDLQPEGQMENLARLSFTLGLTNSRIPCIIKSV